MIVRRPRWRLDRSEQLTIRRAPTRQSTWRTPLCRPAAARHGTGNHANDSGGLSCGTGALSTPWGTGGTEDCQCERWSQRLRWTRLGLNLHGSMQDARERARAFRTGSAPPHSRCCFVCSSLARHLPPVEVAQPPMHRPAAAHDVPVYTLPDLKSSPRTPVLATARFTAPSGSDVRPCSRAHGPSGGGGSRQRAGSGDSANSDLDFADLADEDYDRTIGHGGGRVRASVSTPVGAAMGESQREPFESVMLSTPTTSGHIMPAVPCLQVCGSWPPAARTERRPGLAAVLGRRALRSASRTVCAARYCSARGTAMHALWCCGSASVAAVLLGHWHEAATFCMARKWSTHNRVPDGTAEYTMVGL